MMFVVNKDEPEFDVSIVSDTSGSWGCRAICSREWFQLRWADLAGFKQDQNITIKELLPIVVAAARLGANWTRKTVRAQCDNMAVVAIVNAKSSKEHDTEMSGLPREANHCFHVFVWLFGIEQLWTLRI